MPLMQFVVHHVKTTKNTEVYGPDPMDAGSPLVNTQYFQKNAFKLLPPPPRLVVTIDVAGE